MQFCLIASLIARVHGKVRSLSKIPWLVQPITEESYQLLIQLDLHILSVMLGTISRGLLRWKLEMHTTVRNGLYIHQQVQPMIPLKANSKLYTEKKLSAIKPVNLQQPQQVNL